ncbi:MULTISPECIES: precorrin-8X methylmutase [Roseburia]|jgi:threonine-phosphate decarboxylase|uniref:precorrin-8X methylmutase n=1 Tax=Roseburia TaxID=841 RepID=UPI00164B93CF
MQYHGGDIYRNQIRLDFSVNTNPLGMPDPVKEALHQAVEEAENYPDIRAQALSAAVTEQLQVRKEQLVFGNGASELFHAVLHAIKPSKILIPVPSFLGYEEAAKAIDCEVIFYEMKKEENFCLTDRILDVLDENISLVFLANPNNPVGNLVEPELIFQIAEKCRQCDITLVLDECFMELTGKEQTYSFLKRLDEFPNVVVIRAFTKLYAIPGVRLGYLVCEQNLAEKIRLQLPEWNLSVFAQRAGVAAIKEQEYIARAVVCIQTQRQFLLEELQAAGCSVFDSDADYLLFYSEMPLYELFLQRGILIRDCSNFRGLQRGYYRIAVKSEEQNRMFAEVLREIHENAQAAERIDLMKEKSEERNDRVKGQECIGKTGATAQLVHKTGAVEFVLPGDIEGRSFAIITKELAERGIVILEEQEPVTKRVIHTSADFGYADTLTFSENAVAVAKSLIRNGADIVTDTNMALSGINKKVLETYGGMAHCFMADEEVAKEAKERRVTRAVISMEHAAKLDKPVVFAVGNAPTALIRLYELISDGIYRPAFIIGVPVGFVNVEVAKEMILHTNVPCIVNRGRKGGSNVAAAICNALLYEVRREDAVKKVD